MASAMIGLVLDDQHAHASDGTSWRGDCFAFRAVRWTDGKWTTITRVVLGQPGQDQIAAGLAAAEAMVDRITDDRLQQIWGSELGRHCLRLEAIDHVGHLRSGCQPEGDNHARTFGHPHALGHILGVSKNAYVLATSRRLHLRHDLQRTGTGARPNPSETTP